MKTLKEKKEKSRGITTSSFLFSITCVLHYIYGWWWKCFEEEYDATLILHHWKCAVHTDAKRHSCFLQRESRRATEGFPCWALREFSRASRRYNRKRKKNMTVGRLLNFAQEKKGNDDDEFHLYPLGENVAFQQTNSKDGSKKKQHNFQIRVVFFVFFFFFSSWFPPNT